MDWQDGWEHLVETFRDKYARAQERTAEYRAQQQAELDRINQAIRQRVAERTMDPVAAEATDDGKYTQHALEQWNIAHDEWVIQKNDSYYIFVNGNYQHRHKSELPNCVHRDLIRAPIDLEMENAKGGTKEMTPQEIVRCYGSVALAVESSLALQRSYYDAKTGVFHEAVCPLRRLEPKYDANVQRWLELLGGADKERFLDWVATVTDLQYQTCAVYFHADSGAGKSLFAHGLKRLWTTGAPPTLVEVFGAFNEAMTKCPLIFADERLPERRTITEDLRELIGSSSRQLSRKFMPSSSLVGACRLIIAGNSKDLIKPSNDMTAFDLKAVADRILFLEPDPGTSAFLTSLGGRPVVNAWITEDRLAQHALWLKENRKLTENKDRFLVMGQHDRFHDRLAVNSGAAKQVCEVLVKSFDKPIPPNLANFMLYGCGELLVNVRAIEGLWAMTIGDNERRPAVERLARALASISHESMKVMLDGRTSRYARVRVEQLFAWADENGLTDAGYLKDKINEKNDRMAAILTRHKTKKEAA